MYRINRLNQRNDRPIPVDTGHSPYNRTEPPKPWEPGWQSPPIDPNSPEHQEQLAAWAITHYWRPEEKADDDFA